MMGIMLAALFASSLAHGADQAVAAGVGVEFYNKTLDNYFVTANAAEVASVDQGGSGPGWVRTTKNFAVGGSAPVCRFYGSQNPGPNSHFYTVNPDECTELKVLEAVTPATQKRWNFESNDFQAAAPVGGTCPAGTIPVYRAYNNGFTRGVDSNHRLNTRLAAMLEVVNRGWVDEGVAMCAPTPCSAPQVWNGNACATPPGIEVSGPETQLPAGCRMWTEDCYQRSIDTIKWVATPAVATGFSDRPIVFGVFINGTTPSSQDGPYSVNPFYADTMEPFSGNGIYHGVDVPIVSVVGTSRGVFKRYADGTCYEMRWFPPTTQPNVSSNIWDNVPVSCH